MSDSIREQLLGMGFKPAPKPERKPQQGKGNPNNRGPRQTAEAPRSGRPGGKPQGPRPPRAAAGGTGKPRSQEEMDLAKAYAIRAQTEKREKLEAEAARQEAARLRREAKARFDAFIVGKSLNEEAADIARHFEYGGKIKRVYVTADQLKALNAGELGVLQQNGRYLVVTAAVLAEAEAIFPQGVALKVDPDAPAEADPYSDPQYQIPDDLVW